MPTRTKKTLTKRQASALMKELQERYPGRGHSDWPQRAVAAACDPMGSAEPCIAKIERALKSGKLKLTLRGAYSGHCGKLSDAGRNTALQQLLKPNPWEETDRVHRARREAAERLRVRLSKIVAALERRLLFPEREEDDGAQLIADVDAILAKKPEEFLDPDEIEEMRPRHPAWLRRSKPRAKKEAA